MPSVQPWFYTSHVQHGISGSQALAQMGAVGRVHFGAISSSIQPWDLTRHVAPVVTSKDMATCLAVASKPVTLLETGIVVGDTASFVQTWH